MRAEHRRSHGISGICCIVLALAGCADEATVETEVTVHRDSPECSATVDGTPRMVNRYLVELLVDVASGEDGISSCLQCSATSSCAKVATYCRCTGAVSPNVQGMSSAVSGIRFPDLDPDAKYCIRVLAAEHATEGRADPTEECSCPDDLPLYGRACAFHEAPVVLALDASAVSLELVCLDDLPGDDDPPAPFLACPPIGRRELGL